MARLFFSYSHADEGLRDRLEKSLAMLKHEGLIESWHDRCILVGDAFDDMIADELEKADVILLLASPDFLASRYCWAVEVKRAMERHAEGTARVIPVILRPCEWDRTPFAKLQATPKDGLPVTKWPNQDEAFLSVTKAIRSALEGGTTARPISAPQPAPPQHRPVGPRSSNLRLRKEFTDADHDRFLDEAFRFIHLFFENSLRELEQRNEEISTALRVIDANHFTAVIYKNGKALSQCRISLERSHRSSGEIQYSTSLDARSNSYNESLHSESDDQGMYLKAMGMQMAHSQDAHMTFEGGAEYYWSLLFGQLQ